MSRLPNPGKDEGNWGQILNEFLRVEHDSNGKLRPTGSLAAKYTKPQGGIPKNDLSSGVQIALDKVNAMSVESLNDTDINGAGHEQVLAYDATEQKWRNATIPPAPDASSSQKGSLQLSGDLSGTAANPQVKSRTVKATIFPNHGDYPVSAYANAAIAIQTALNEVAQSGGGEVFIGEGTYEIVFTIGIPSNVTVRGSRSKKTLLRLADNSNCHVITNSDHTNGNTNITLSHLIIEANSDHQTLGRGIFFRRVTQSFLEHITVTNTRAEAVVVEKCQNVHASQMSITHCHGTGFLFTNSEHCSVKNSELSHNHVGVALAATSNHNEVTSNRILHSSHYSLLGGTVLDTQFNSYNTFSHNIIEYGGDDALVLDHNPFTTCIGNQVRYCGKSAGDQGLPVDTSPNSIISGNIVEYNFADGIEVKNSSSYCTITGNISRNNSSPAVGGLSNGAGIVIRAGIVGCTITGNACYCDEAVGSQRRGIILTGTGVNYNTVIGNVVYGNSVNQIELSSNVGTHNTVNNNSGANAANTNVLISRVADQPVRHTNSTTSNTIEVIPTGNTGSSRNKGAFFVENSQNPGVGFGMYTTHGSGAVAPLMSLRNGDTADNTTWDYNPAIALLTNVSDQSGLLLDQLKTLATSRAGIVVKSSAVQNMPNAYGLIAGQQLHADSNIPVYWGDHVGSGMVFSARANGGTVFNADQNGNGLGMSIDRDTTNTNSTTGSMRILDTANVTDGLTYTKSGTTFTVASSIAATAGTITDSSKVAVFAQNNPNATGDVLTITNTGNGASFVIDGSTVVAKAGKVGFGTTGPTAIVDTPASTASHSGFRIRQGVAPTAPNSGDIWQDGSHMYTRIGNNTHQLDQQASGGVSSTSKTIAQTAHGFSVGSYVRYNGAAYVKALANTLTNAECVGVVSHIPNADTFTLTTNGHISGLSGLTAGSRYYLSATTAGVITNSTPNVGQISKPVFVADSATSGYVSIFDTETVRAEQNTFDWSPGDQSLVAWAFDPVVASNSSVLPTAGVMYMARIAVPTGTTIANLVVDISAAGAGLTSCGAALYQNGTLLGQTTDQSGAWNTTNSKVMPLTGGPVTVSGEYVYVAIWANGTTLPSFSRGAGRSNINIGTSATTYRFASSGTGITTVPPTTLGTLTASSISWWLAVS